jgi:enoyl-CoA hydratase/carnithine racemase
MQQTNFEIENAEYFRSIRLTSPDLTNRLDRDFVERLTTAMREISTSSLPLIITGNKKFFSAGADLNEISALTGPAAYEFAKSGQVLMHAVASYPNPVFAAISGFCMGGGLDLTLACHYRIASPDAVFGHRGAALGLITGWGGTQRLPRLVGKARALQMFVAAEKIDAVYALQIGLVDAIAQNPVDECIRRLQH